MSKIQGGGPKLPLPLSPQPEPTQKKGLLDGILPSNRTFEQKGDGYEISGTERKGLFGMGSQKDVKEVYGDEGNRTTRNTQFVNGKLENQTTLREQTFGNVSTSLKREQGYNDDGKLVRSRLTHNITERFGDHTTIGNTSVLDGSFRSHTSELKYNNGGTSMTSTTTRSSGAQTQGSGDKLEYKGGSYLNNGKYRTGRWVNGRYETNRGMTYDNYNRTTTKTTISHDFKHESRDTDAMKDRAAAMKERGDRRAKTQKGLDLAASLGLKMKIMGGGKPTTTTLAGVDPTKTTSADGRTTTETLLGPRVSSKQYGEVAIGANGLSARGDVDIRAGLYAQGKVTHDTGFGTVKGNAGVKAEAYAEANGQAKLNLNGLDAKGHVGIGAEISAEAGGSYRLPGVNIGGTKVDAGISAKGRVAAEAQASASGRVQITGDPPTAVVSGQAGASAVVKAEGDVKVDAGPFSVTAQGYVSAGAEAQVNGGIGYEDGKLSLSFGAGAALGVGAGGRVQVQVDLKKAGQIATGLAKEGYDRYIDHHVDKLDVTGDNNFDMQDVKAIGGAVAENVTEAAEVVVDTVSDAAEAVVDTVSDAAGAVVDVASNAASAVGGAVSDAAEAVGDFFSGW